MIVDTRASSLSIWTFVSGEAVRERSVNSCSIRSTSDSRARRFGRRDPCPTGRLLGQRSGSFAQRHRVGPAAPNSSSCEPCPRSFHTAIPAATTKASRTSFFIHPPGERESLPGFRQDDEVSRAPTFGENLGRQPARDQCRPQGMSVNDACSSPASAMKRTSPISRDRSRSPSLGMRL